MLVITECLNSACRRALYYLRAGRIVRTEYREGMRVKLEHFWLCGDCSQFFDFRLFSDRPAIAIRRAGCTQRFVRTEGAALVRGKQQVEESASPPTIMTPRWEWASGQPRSRPEPAVHRGSVHSYP
jgi:hypothetical protein